MKARKTKRFGWLPDLPDTRDHLFAAGAATMQTLPSSVDLRPGCPPVYDQGDLGSCHDSETEVLTDGGWRLFGDLHGAERLATVNPETSELSYETPTRLVRFPYAGKLICSSNRSVNFRVTPEHKMLVRRWDESERTLSPRYELVAAESLGWHCGLMNRVIWKGETGSGAYTLPGVDHKHRPQRQAKEVPMAAWLRFLGIYLAEGTMIQRDQQPGRVSYQIQIAASKDREKQFVREVLSALDIQPLELSDRFTFENRRIFEAMAALGFEGVKAKRKFVPRFVFNVGAELIAEFLAGHFAGNGCEQNGLRSHYTSSKQLATDLQLLIFLSGSESRISVRPARDSVMKDGRKAAGQMDECRVSVCERKNLSLERRESLFLMDYEGEVFCAEVPTHHTLVTRREGKILISGNCTANAVAGAIEFDRLRQNLSDYVPSRLFIYYNERVIMNTVASDSGAMIRDGIKSVGHLGACPEKQWPYRQAKFKSKPTAACFKEALAHRAVSYQKIPRHLPQMKGCLADGFPFVFGFTVYDSFEGPEVAKTGIALMPTPQEGSVGGHAVMAVGYDDATQRFLVRNSWGTDWGQGGYFTLPYLYLTEPQLSSDFWTIRVVQ